MEERREKVSFYFKDKPGNPGSHYLMRKVAFLGGNVVSYKKLGVFESQEKMHLHPFIDSLEGESFKEVIFNLSYKCGVSLDERV